TGKVLEELKGRSAFDLNGERARRLARLRPGHTGKELIEQVRKLTGSESTLKSGSTIVIGAGAIFRDGYKIASQSYHPPSGIYLPALYFDPKEPAPSRRRIIYLNG